jgi:DNA-binding response OmpR family regulator
MNRNDDHCNSRPAKGSTHSLGSAVKNRILLVDDDRDTCLTFKRMLEEQSFDVHAYNTPQDVMKRFEPGIYDLVVLDIKMPGINGIELYQEIRRLDKDVRFCFITASEGYYTGIYPELEKEKCFMQKPISLDDFVNRVKLALAGSMT